MASPIGLRFCGLLGLLLHDAPEDAGGEQEGLPQVNRQSGFGSFGALMFISWFKRWQTPAPPALPFELPAETESKSERW